MRRLLAPTMGGLMVAAAIFIAVPSAAATGATCAAKAGVTLKPGISLTASTGTFVSKPGGQIACVGTVKGVNVGGQGSLTFSGKYGTSGGDTCAKGAGSGTISASIPKVGGGTLLVKGPFTFTRVGSAVQVSGTVNGATLAGNLQFAPDAGQNCAQTVVKSATVAGGAAIGGSS